MQTRATIAVGTLLVVTVGCTTSPNGKLNANKNRVPKFNEATNAGEKEALKGIMTDDFTRYSAATASPSVSSREDIIRLQKVLLGSFPDQHVEFEKMVTDGDLVAVVATYSGTQTGTMGNFPATGKTPRSPFLAMFRIESGRSTERWVEWNNVSMLRQLNLFPP